MNLFHGQLEIDLTDQCWWCFRPSIAKAKGQRETRGACEVHKGKLKGWKLREAMQEASQTRRGN